MINVNLGQLLEDLNKYLPLARTPTVPPPPGCEGEHEFLHSNVPEQKHEPLVVIPPPPPSFGEEHFTSSQERSLSTQLDILQTLLDEPENAPTSVHFTDFPQMVQEYDPEYPWFDGRWIVDRHGHKRWTRFLPKKQRDLVFLSQREKKTRAMK